MQLLEETLAVISLGKLCSEHRCSYEWKTAELHDWSKMGRQSLVYDFVPLFVPGLSSSSSSFSVFTSRTIGSLNIFWWIRTINRPNDDSTCQACMGEIDANKPWQASLGRPWFTAHRKRDGRRSNARHFCLVAALHRKSRGPGDACARTFLWKRELRFGRWCFQSGNTKSEQLNSLLWRPKLRNLPKYMKVLCRKRNEGSIPRAKKFGDLMTADHNVFKEGSESQNNHRYAVVVQDLATHRIQSHPCKNKNSQEMEMSSRKFFESSRTPKVIFTDNSLEFGKSFEELSWIHRTSTPYRSETNGIAERSIRRVKGENSPIIAIGIGWQVVVRFYGMLLPFAKFPRPPGRRENSVWTKIWGILQKDQSFHLKHWWNTSPNSERDKAGIHQFGEKASSRRK